LVCRNRVDKASRGSTNTRTATTHYEISLFCIAVRSLRYECDRSGSAIYYKIFFSQCWSGSYRYICAICRDIV
jgi:hypothetical protein